MAYTVNDTAQVLRRVDGDLAAIVAAVRAADPAVRSIVLAGGFSRGEGAVVRGKPQNDYDIVAIRGPGRPTTPYNVVRQALERSLGLHIDLAAVPVWRLRWLKASIFWYETAVRGRVLWGDDLLGRIRARSPDDLDPREGLRLLVNRAAGLLLVAGSPDATAVRLQSAKALLAAADARLLATGRFAPSQRERWAMILSMRAAGIAPRGLEPTGGWFEWAFHHKVDPSTSAPREPAEAWRAARRAILQSIPGALEHAGLDSIEQYGRQGGLLDALVYLRRSAGVPSARRWTYHPTGRVRVATVRLLEAASQGRVEHADAVRCLADISRGGSHALPPLEGLRAATLQ